MITRFAAAASIAALLLLSACAAKPRPTQQAAPVSASPPPDFTLAVTVFAPPSTHARPDIAPNRRPARYLVEADGLLRVALGPGTGDTTYPPAVRPLTTEQLASLYNDLRTTGWLTTESPARVSSSQTYRPNPGSTAYLVTFTADGRRRTIVAKPNETAPRALVDRLTKLAWIQ